MKFTKLILSALAILGLTASVAQARHHRRHHGPRVSFGLGVNVGRPMHRPYYAAPCYGGYCAPVYAVPAPVRYVPYYARPSFGASFGSGPVNFGFGF